MPTYEYRCTSCGNDFEKFQRMSDEPGADCPKCSGRAERRLSGGAGFLFKGSGFYITDYRSESYKSAAKAESGGGEAKPPSSSSDSSASAPGSAPTPSSSSSSSSSGSGSKSGGKSE